MILTSSSAAGHEATADLSHSLFAKFSRQQNLGIPAEHCNHLWRVRGKALESKFGGPLYCKHFGNLERDVRQAVEEESTPVLC